VFIRRDHVHNGPIPLFFGGLVGLPSVNAHGEAAAYIETDISGFHIGPGSNMNSKLLPFSLQIDLWNSRTALGEDTHTHDPVNHTASPGPDGIFEISVFPHRLAPGNFGTVDIGSPNNSASRSAPSDRARSQCLGPFLLSQQHRPVGRKWNPDAQR
jgi:hypothetical protein